jgi:hypothetical protein
MRHGVGLAAGQAVELRVAVRVVIRLLRQAATAELGLTQAILVLNPLIRLLDIPVPVGVVAVLDHQ